MSALPARCMRTVAPDRVESGGTTGDVCGDREASRALAANAVTAIAVSAATATAIASATSPAQDARSRWILME